MNGGRPHVWPSGAKSSGGAPMLTSRASRSCSSQASAPSGSAPMARSWMSRTPSALAAASSWSVEEELEPRVEGHPVRARRRGRRRPRRRRGGAARRGHRDQRGAVHLGQRAVPRPPLERRRPARPATRASACVARAPCAGRPEALERRSRWCGPAPRRGRRSGSRRAARRPRRPPRATLRVRSAAPGTSSTRSSSGLRHRRLDGEYGLVGSGATGRGGVQRAERRARRRRGRRARGHARARRPGRRCPSSPRERVVGTCIASAPGAQVGREVAAARARRSAW